ncbi:hypothetical protein [Streptomyces sp. NBC_01237]|uniref:hypothetical protein n=1 Tax=Streptomyces sp. NBC_01237 TaxID=2903790 RepID=UPI002DD7F02F|nr:hypothetical protein [Streptomyces sp. NBC_01237]WRZ77981.1 hypothetical protein OG251_41095 [Streptomyces sp. NBC_01237]
MSGRRGRKTGGASDGGDRGQSALEYLGLLTVVGAVVGGVVATSLSGQLSGGLTDAVCRIAPSGGFAGHCGPEASASDVSANAQDDNVATVEGSHSAGRLLPGERPLPQLFEPAKCLLSEDQTKDAVSVQILFLKLNHSEELKVQQWSDGTVTVERMKTDSVGVTASVSAGIPGLRDWGGSASLSGSFATGNGVGGQWEFANNRSGDSNADLKANLDDAKDFVEALGQSDTCEAMAGTPVSPISQVGCSNNAMRQMQKDDPTKMPDLDISKTTTELAGGVSFGQSFTRSKKKGGDEIGSVSTDLASGSMTNDVVVLRSSTGEDDTVTFVYTFSLTGKTGVGTTAEGNRMQQVSVTYDADDYDAQEKRGEPHRPTDLEITTSTEKGSSTGTSAGGGVNAGPLTIEVSGGKGNTTSEIHTETAAVGLIDGQDSETVENWLRGRGNPAASDGMPTPSDAAAPTDEDTGPLMRLLHDRAGISTVDYKADTDWWNASLGIGFGISAGQVSLGFKLFGIDISHEHRTQTVTGDPVYAGAPSRDGNRPWKPWTNCTRTTPIA